MRIRYFLGVLYFAGIYCCAGAAFVSFPITATPSPSSTPSILTPTPSPQPTAHDPGLDLRLLDTNLQPGDLFFLFFTLYSGDEPRDLDVYVLLGFDAFFWSWPSWSDVTADLDFKSYEMESDEVREEIVLTFFWPVESVGQGEGVFYGAAFKKGTFEQVGDISIVEFSYR